MASSARVPINPEILIWARKQFNMDTGYVAKKINVKEEKIKDWEKGTSSPTYNQLDELAKVVQKPIEIFFYPEPPELQKPDAKLRALYGEYLQETPTEILLIMNKAEIMQDNLRELCLGKNPSDRLITRQTFEGSISECAEKVREYLSAPLSEQTEIQGSGDTLYYNALKYWRQKLADAGIYIFKENFSNKAYSGLCLDDTEFPIIYLNSSMVISRQIFTIFHELYHLLNKKSGIDFIDDKNVIHHLTKSVQETEKDCDKFASEFLVPSDDFEKTILASKDMENILTRDEYAEVLNICIRPLARRYSVSNDMITLKLINKGYLVESDYAKYRSNYNKSESKKDGGPDYYTKQVSYLGTPYIKLVLEKQYEYGLEDYQSAEYLGVKTKNIEGITKKLYGDI